MTETFEDYVGRWEELDADIKKAKAALKKKTDVELKMRRAIAESLKQALGDNLKEGVNNFEMQDGRTIKFTYGIKRSIEEGEIANAREEFRKLNDVEITFDDLLRVKHELEKREWNKLSAEAKKAVSRMIESKEEAPKLEIE